MDEAFSALDAIIKEDAQELFLDVWSENLRLTRSSSLIASMRRYIWEKKLWSCRITPGQIVRNH